MSVSVIPISPLLGSPLVDHEGNELGRVEDFIVRLSDESHPPITGLKARIGGRDVFVPIDRVVSLDPERVQLTSAELDLRPFERREGEILLGGDLLGRRLISLANGRLVRAGDIGLAETNEHWLVVGVDIRIRSLWSRIWPFNRRRRRDEASELLDWASIQPFLSHVPTARLRIPYRKLAHLHPAQIADLVEASSYEEGSEIIDAVGEDRELEADVFEELAPGYGGEFLRKRSDEQVAAVLATMAADDAADMLGELDQARRSRVLGLLPEDKHRTIRNLLGYHPSTAGGLMTPEYMSAPVDATVAQARDTIRTASGPPRSIETLYVLDSDGRVVGVASAGDLLRAEPSQPLREAMRSPIESVEPSTDLAELACLLADYDLAGVPVVDNDGHMLGLVTIDDVLPLVIPEEWRRRAEASREE